MHKHSIVFCSDPHEQRIQRRQNDDNHQQQFYQQQHRQPIMPVSPEQRLRPKFERSLSRDSYSTITSAEETPGTVWKTFTKNGDRDALPLEICFATEAPVSIATTAAETTETTSSSSSSAITLMNKDFNGGRMTKVNNNNNNNFTSSNTASGDRDALPVEILFTPEAPVVSRSWMQKARPIPEPCMHEEEEIGDDHEGSGVSFLPGNLRAKTVRTPPRTRPLLTTRRLNREPSMGLACLDAIRAPTRQDTFRITGTRFEI